ncbi:hypothetical protein BDY24DRAFT_400317 [Mrakia frigida]|uniref:uncharacterized protein n=1 Tax=Mrakia frigida TaxID=29902 RepID=UPI003FCC03A5
MIQVEKEKPKKKPRGLKRNEACQSCRDRKLRCDAARPACATCIRSYNHAMQHLKPGRAPPVYPVCSYDDPETLDSSSSPKEPKITAPTPSVAPRQDWRPPKLDSPNFNPYPPPLVNNSLPSSSNYPSSSSSPSSYPGTSTPFYPTFQQPPSISRHPAPSPHPLQTTFQPIQPYLPSPSSSYLPHNNYALPPFNPSPIQNNLYPYIPNGNGYNTANFVPPYSSSAEVSDVRKPDSKRPRFEDSPEDVVDEEGEQLQGFLAGMGVDLSAPGPSNGQGTSTVGMGEAGTNDDSSSTFLLQLLWPGWPPHLPPPGKLEHIVNNFFKFSPFANQIFNKARFLSRLNLPPTHHNFPHPCLLHAICAATARFVGGLVLVPPSATLFPPSQEATSKNDLLGQPSWDGVGPRPTEFTKGLDEDFGQIHAFWSNSYVDRARHCPEHWLEATQSLLVLTHYYHQHGLWLGAWSAVGSMVRLAIPLGLNAPLHVETFLGRKFTPGSVRGNIAASPKDEIERVERQNLFWLILCLDTYASASTQLQGGYETNNIRVAFPTSQANFPIDRPPPPPSQFGDSPDIIFALHPTEHANSFCLNVKGSVLLRRVVDFVRVTGKDVDPRGRAEFRDLDSLITAFRESIPAFSNDSFILNQGGDGMAIDRDLVVAQALPHVARLTLHDPYYKGFDPLDLSSYPIRDALSGLINQVHVLCRSNFDFALLLPFLTFAWFSGAKCLITFLKAAIELSDLNQAQSLLAEIGVFRSAITRVGERLPLGVRQCVMLDNLLTETLSSPACQQKFPSEFGFVSRANAFRG